MAATDPRFMVPESEDASKMKAADKEFITDGGEPLPPDEDQPVAPDQFDPKWETSRWEIWAYYAYYSTTHAPPSYPLSKLHQRAGMLTKPPPT